MLSELGWINDLLLAVMALMLAGMTLISRNRHQAVVLFMAFGLVLSLAWVRLQAPDLALAEAAIGAGLTGVMLLLALNKGAPNSTTQPSAQPSAQPPAKHSAAQPKPFSVSPMAVLTLALLALLAAAMISAALPALQAASSPAEAVSIPAQVMAHLPQTGVSNPVTAVLLNYRAYDTLLEIAVLLAAVLGILAISPPLALAKPGSVAVMSLMRWLVPLLVLLGGYLLWIGAKAPGGAFQAGAVWAGAASLLYLNGALERRLLHWSSWRWALVAGIGVFLISIGLGQAMGLEVLQWLPSWASWQILLIEAAATFSVAAALSIAVFGSLAGLDPSGSSNQQTSGGKHG